MCKNPNLFQLWFLSPVFFLILGGWGEEEGEGEGGMKGSGGGGLFPRILRVNVQRGAFSKNSEG